MLMHVDSEELVGATGTDCVELFSLRSSLIQAVVFHLVLPRTVRHCSGEQIGETCAVMEGGV